MLQFIFLKHWKAYVWLIAEQNKVLTACRQKSVLGQSLPLFLFLIERFGPNSVFLEKTACVIRNWCFSRNGHSGIGGCLLPWPIDHLQSGLTVKECHWGDSFRTSGLVHSLKSSQSDQIKDVFSVPDKTIIKWYWGSGAASPKVAMVVVSFSC